MISSGNYLPAKTLRTRLLHRTLHVTAHVRGSQAIISGGKAGGILRFWTTVVAVIGTAGPGGAKYPITGQDLFWLRAEDPQVTAHGFRRWFEIGVIDVEKPEAVIGVGVDGVRSEERRSTDPQQTWKSIWR